MSEKLAAGKALDELVSISSEDSIFDIMFKETPFVVRLLTDKLICSLSCVLYFLSTKEKNNFNNALKSQFTNRNLHTPKQKPRSSSIATENWTVTNGDRTHSSL